MIFGDNGKYNPKGVREIFIVGPPTDNTGNNGLITYREVQIPKNAAMVFFMAVGPGGGGGAGLTAATSTAKGGGGGGGGGGIVSLLVPARFISNVLYCMVPQGASGGQSSGSNAAFAQNLIVSQGLQGGIAATQNLLLRATAGAPGGGGAGSGNASGGAAGSGAAYTAPWVLASAGAAGQAGAIGGDPGTPPAGGNLAVPVGSPNIWGSGGAGGGSATSGNAVSAGGNITGGGPFPTLSGGAGVASSGNGGNGLPGGYFNQPFFNAWGGSGGGANATGHVGGTGGAGGYGSGGGGGGAGVTFGPGGNGGPAFIYIAWW